MIVAGFDSSTRRPLLSQKSAQLFRNDSLSGTLEAYSGPVVNDSAIPVVSAGRFRRRLLVAARSQALIAAGLACSVLSLLVYLSAAASSAEPDKRALGPLHLFRSRACLLSGPAMFSLLLMLIFCVASPVTAGAVDAVILACAAVLAVDSTARYAVAVSDGRGEIGGLLQHFIEVFTVGNLSLDVSVLAGAWAVRVHSFASGWRLSVE